MPESRPKLSSFCFEIFRVLGGETSSLRGQKILLACSGGLDSVVLVDIFLSLQSRWNLRLAIAHIHHGDSSSSGVSASRDRSRDFVREIARKHALEFIECRFEGTRELKSEADLREFRLMSIASIVEAHDIDRVALGHHADDLLETRFMRLIRGTGPEGLRAMQMLTAKTVRPFLKSPKSKLHSYAGDRKLLWTEDVSNSDETYFRNWIRRTWLPLLESRKPGSRAALSRSLDLFADAAAPTESPAPPSSFDRQHFQQLSVAQRQDHLVRLGRVFEVKDFGKSKVGEVLKRLDRLAHTQQKSTSFQVGGLVWKIDPRQISVSKV